MRLELDKLLLTIGFTLFVSGCASTNTPEDLGKLEFTGFTEKSDGSAYQSVMGVSCPREIDGMIRHSAHVYNDRGTDASCTYASNDDRLFTLYLSKFPHDNLGVNFQDAKAAIEGRESLSAYKYDEDLSNTCSSVTLDEAAIFSGFSGLLSGENKTNEIKLALSPSAVYVSDAKMSFVVVEEMFDKEFFKVRYTGPYNGEISVEENCQLARDVYLSVKKGVEKDRGIEVSKEEGLLGLINAADDS